MKKEEKIIKVIEGRERGGSQGKQDGGRALGEKKKRNRTWYKQKNTKNSINNMNLS